MRTISFFNGVPPNRLCCGRQNQQVLAKCSRKCRKPMMRSHPKKSEPTEHTAGPDRLLSTIEASVPQPTDSHRQRKGMSLKEYLQKARSL
mmetsp:Transcript_34835/g.105017  ORF Transcript_34835/g.105017 Transcript_34835/m.105017 type:complete len:90 (+) Transcript_34835:1683-1952(+)